MVSKLSKGNRDLPLAADDLSEGAVQGRATSLPTAEPERHAHKGVQFKLSVVYASRIFFEWLQPHLAELSRP